MKEPESVASEIYKALVKASKLKSNIIKMILDFDDIEDIEMLEKINDFVNIQKNNTDE